MIQTLFTAADAAVFEILFQTNVFSPEPYDVFIDGKLYIRAGTSNVFSVYGLAGGREYTLTVRVHCSCQRCGSNHTVLAQTVFRTQNRTRITVEPSTLDDDTGRLQHIIDNTSQAEYIYFSPGEYRVTALFLRDNSAVELASGCTVLGCLDRTKFPILRADETRSWNGLNIPLGTWEGQADDSFASIFTGIGIHDFCLYGQGVIDCRADKTDWWVQHRVKRIARRPKGIFLHTSTGGTIAGITVKNTPSWNQHPFYCSNLQYLDLDLQNPPHSPTTDGCDPESCDTVLIAGCRISVGDDCIAVKSGKAGFAASFGVPSQNITIRNCIMADGHGGVTLGSELSSGLYNIVVSRCIFRGTDRGLRIKTQRGRGSKAVLNNINFSDILMENVKAPFVINAFYKAGNDEADEYRFARTPQIVDERTPRLGSFTFKNIQASGAHWCAGYFLGLPEQPIESVTLENVAVSFAPDAQSGAAAMTCENEQFCRAGFIFENVSQAVLYSVSITGHTGEQLIFRGIKPALTTGQ